MLAQLLLVNGCQNMGPARVVCPELRIGKNPVNIELHDSFWYGYVFEARNVQMETYQLKE